MIMVDIYLGVVVATGVVMMVVVNNMMIERLESVGVFVSVEVMLVMLVTVVAQWWSLV